MSFEQLRNSTECERSGSDCCIRRYHVSKEMREAAAGEVLECMRELHSIQGQYAVTVKKKQKNGNNHGTFTTKVVRSVFILLATREYDVFYSDWGGEDTP